MPTGPTGRGPLPVTKSVPNTLERPTRIFVRVAHDTESFASQSSPSEHLSNDAETLPQFLFSDGNDLEWIQPRRGAK